MKRHWIAAGWMLATAGAIAQDENGLSIEREWLGRSRYVWRGIVLEPKRTFETSTTLQYGNTWFNVWSYGRETEAWWHRRAREVDFVIGWDLEAGNWSLSPSFTSYTFPHHWEAPTAEVGLEAEKALGGHLSLLANAYVDVSAARGASYSELGLGYERDLGSGWSLDSTVRLGFGSRAFNGAVYEVRRDGWNVALADAGLSFELAPGIVLRGAAEFSRTLDRRLREASEHPHNRVWVLQLMVSR